MSFHSAALEPKKNLDHHFSCLIKKSHFRVFISIFFLSLVASLTGDFPLRRILSSLGDDDYGSVPG